MPLRFCTPAHVMDPQYPGVVEEIINLGEHWQSTQLRANRSEIINLTRRISEKFSACYAKLKEAGALALSEQEQNMSLTDSFALEEQLQHLTRDIFHSESPRSRHA